MVDSFLKYLQYEKRVSMHTTLAYSTDLAQFQSYIACSFEINDLEIVDYPMIRSWVASLAEAGFDSNSINRKIACLRSFFKFLLKEEKIRVNPMTKIRVLKTSRKLPSFLKESQINEVLDNPGTESTSSQSEFTMLRDKLVLELFYGTGIRLSELLNLTENNIDYRNQTIKVLGKRNKERVIPFGNTLLSIIKTYKSLKRKLLESNEKGLLIVTETGSACYPMLIYRIVRRSLNGVTGLEKKSPHILRHTYATHLLDGGAEINAVKELLGHSSLAATQVYTHNSIEKLKKVFNQAHPKA